MKLIPQEKEFKYPASEAGKKTQKDEEATRLSVVLSVAKIKLRYCKSV